MSKRNNRQHTINWIHFIQTIDVREGEREWGFELTRWCECVTELETSYEVEKGTNNNNSQVLTAVALKF